MLFGVFEKKKIVENQTFYFLQNQGKHKVSVFKKKEVVKSSNYTLKLILENSKLINTYFLTKFMCEFKLFYPIVGDQVGQGGLDLRFSGSNHNRDREFNHIFWAKENSFQK